MSEEHIHTITAIAKSTKPNKTCGPTRTFGFYHDIDDAFKAVEVNRGSMEECLYDYIVVERIGEGIHASVEEEYWFEWKDSAWRPRSKPTEFQAVVNWGLG